MKCFFVLALIAGAANAFIAPSVASVKTSSSLRMSGVDGMAGVSSETGGKIFDPWGLADVHAAGGPLPAAHPQWLREAELKHGRQAMLAVVGAETCHHGFVLPGCGYDGNTDIFSAFGEFATKNPGGLVQLALFFAVVEGSNFPAGMYDGQGKREPGNYGFDPLGLLKNKSEAQTNDMKLKELKNGRLAMIAFAAIISEHVLPGSVPFLAGQGY